jgi:hypothetical protein
MIAAGSLGTKQLLVGLETQGSDGTDVNWCLVWVHPDSLCHRLGMAGNSLRIDRARILKSVRSLFTSWQRVLDLSVVVFSTLLLTNSL